MMRSIRHATARARAMHEVGGQTEQCLVMMSQDQQHFGAKTHCIFPPKRQNISRQNPQILGGPLGRACFGSFVAVNPPCMQQ